MSVDRLGGGGGRFGNDFANGAFKAFDGDRRLDVWRDGIPESDSTRKEGVEMTVHRGVRDKVVGRLSGAGFVDDEVLNGDGDSTRSGFVKGGQLAPSPTLLKGSPAELLQIFFSHAWYHCMVASDKSSCSLLNSFDLINLVLLMGVPDAASVFQDGADKGFITGFFNGPGAAMDVPSQKGKGGVCFGMNVVYVSGPGEFAVDSHSKVLGGVCQREFSGVDEVVREDGLLLVGDAEGEAFAGVKFHFVISFPKLEGIEIFLELS